jgi:hypothetical protein
MSSPVESLKDVRVDVINDVAHSVQNEISHLARSRVRWKRFENFSEATAQVFMIFTSVLSFSGATYQQAPYLSFLGGVSSVLTIALLKFSNYCHAESLERTALLNSLLVRVGANPLPVGD